MTQEQIDNNRRIIVEELSATKIEGIEGLIDSMDKVGFFTEQCSSHDDGPGGMANHSLWMLWFGREHFGDCEENAEVLVLACLCHHLSKNAYQKLPVIASLLGNVPENVQQAVLQAEKDSIEYCDCIPFGTKPTAPFCGVEEDVYTDVTFDLGDHVMWMGLKGHDDVFDGSEELSQFMVHHVMSLPVRETKEMGGDGNGKDVLVLSDDNGMYSLMLLSEDGKNGSEDLYRSDRVVFGYTDFEFYISRYPQHRTSYVAARNAKGRWGVCRIREDKKRRSGHVIIIERTVEFTYRNPDKALEAMYGHTGHLIRVKHSNFYSKIDLVK